MGYTLELRKGPRALPPGSSLALPRGLRPLRGDGAGKAVEVELPYDAEEPALRDAVAKLLALAEERGWQAFDPQLEAALDPSSLDRVLQSYRTYRSLAADVRGTGASEAPFERSWPSPVSMILLAVLALAVIAVLGLGGITAAWMTLVGEDQKAHPGEYRDSAR